MRRLLAELRADRLLRALLAATLVGLVIGLLLAARIVLAAAP